VQRAADFLRARRAPPPDVAIILGTGLGGLASEIQDAAAVPYGEIPGFPVSTVPGHKGQLLLGSFAGRRVATMEGRFHYYEGYTLDQITLPVRVLRALGAKLLIVSNACGGLRPDHRLGDLLLIDDHINLMGVNPLVGPNDDRLGPRFPDMSAPYDRGLVDLAERIAAEEGIRAHRGVYAGLTGPCLETRAEYRFLQRIGADAVGMSTVPEVIVAVHAGFRTFGVSVITDRCLPETLEPVKLETILAVAAEAEPKMRTLVRRLVSEAGAGAGAARRRDEASS
jgi:purine-nucleoside phosphorylase